MVKKDDYKVVCFGEILWDILPTGAVPGGAPMNVADRDRKPAWRQTVGGGHTFQFFCIMMVLRFLSGR